MSGLSACGGAGRGGLDPVLPDPPASSSLNNPFMPQTSRLQPKRDPSPVSGEFGARREQGAGLASPPGGRRQLSGACSREAGEGREAWDEGP